MQKQQNMEPSLKRRGTDTLYSNRLAVGIGDFSYAVSAAFTRETTRYDAKAFLMGGRGFSLFLPERPNFRMSNCGQAVGGHNRVTA
jgi:hypothetical protein